MPNWQLKCCLAFNYCHDVNIKNAWPTFSVSKTVLVIFLSGHNVMKMMSYQPSLTFFDEKLLIWSVASQLGLFCSGATLQEALNNSSRWIRAHEHLLQSGPGDFNSTNVVSWMQQSKLILPRPVPQHAQNIVSFISTIQYTILMPLPLPKHMSWNCPAMPFTLSREWLSL